MEGQERRGRERGNKGRGDREERAEASEMGGGR